VSRDIDGRVDGVMQPSVTEPPEVGNRPRTRRAQKHRVRCTDPGLSPEFLRVGEVFALKAALARMAVDLESVYQTELPYVWHSLRRLGVPEADRADLAHEVFLVVERRLDSFDATRAIRPWLFGIAFRVVAHHRERAAYRREVLGESDEPRAVEPSAEELLVVEDRRRLVLKALEVLPLERRAVFVMHDLDGQTVPQIGEQTGLPINTVYSHLRRARRDFAAEVRRLAPAEDAHG
jgi:RNA polymerase sigma-70 factor (ECF subfamily)